MTSGDVAEALAALAAADRAGFRVAVERRPRVVRDADGFLEDVAVADTVLVMLQLLADRRDVGVDLLGVFTSARVRPRRASILFPGSAQHSGPGLWRDAEAPRCLTQGRVRIC
jgi:hypothetical protein